MNAQVFPRNGRRTALRTVIVDDEPIARQVLREELGSLADIEIIAEAASGVEALDHICASHPDLILLDLQMPGLTGFDVIQRLPPGPLPAVIIVTAYDEHAIRAFESGALDYLLKPVSRERLEKAVERARALRGNTVDLADSLVRLNEAGKARKIVGRLGEEYYLLDIEDVLAFQSDREIVWIVTARQRYLATQNLRLVEARLHGGPFHRVHRNALVNVNHVRKLAPLSSQRWLLTLTNGQELIVSKRLASQVRQLLL